MKSSNNSWVPLFKEGKWKACSAAIRQMLNDTSAGKIEDEPDWHARRIALNNNLFVCDQLGKDWNSTEEEISLDWQNSYCTITEEFCLLRCQHACSKLPLDVILCATCNLMWWGLMKIDPLDQHACQYDALNAAIYSLKIVRQTFGSWNPDLLSDKSMKTDFIDAIDASLSCFVKLTPIQCQLAIEIIILGFLTLLNICENSWEKSEIGFLRTMDNLVDILPQLKVHFSHEEKHVVSKSEVLVKFGLKEIGEVLGEEIFLTTSQALLITISIICLRGGSSSLKENSSKSLKYLNLIKKSDLKFPFLFHYLHAFANLNIGILDASLYHLQHASLSSSNFFMQGRSNILKGQALLLQDKGAAALQALQLVQYKRKEVKLPLCAFLIGKAYQKLGKVKQQIEVWNCLLDLLSSERTVEPKLYSPLAGMEHKLLLAVHNQPEISYEQVLQSSAMAHLSAKQPGEAAEKLLQLLQAKSMVMDDDIEDAESLWKLSELLHDTASALLEAHCTHDAEQICEAALQFHSNRFGLNKSTSDFCSLSEDVIALILLAEVRASQKSSDVSGILNRCVKLLQNLTDRNTELGESHKETTMLAKALLARVFLHKALLNERRKFMDDAVACFQRALSSNENDREIILHYAHHLLNMNQHEESLALWSMYKDTNSWYKKTDSIALSYILGDKISVDLKDEIMSRLGSLETMCQ